MSAPRSAHTGLMDAVAEPGGMMPANQGRHHQLRNEQSDNMLEGSSCP